MEIRDSSPARLLAPIALVVFFITALVIISSAGGTDHKAGAGPTKSERRDLQLTRRAARRARSQAKAVSAGVYVVRTGDTLGSIAQKTGVSVVKLQELNPSLDPQSLLSGQRIKLK